MANDHIDKNIIAIWLHLYICFDRGFEPRWGQTKDYKIGICCLMPIQQFFLAISWREQINF
jgi:hypothetical protein